MPSTRPLAEEILWQLWFVLNKHHMGAENIGTRKTILDKLSVEWALELTPRELRTGLDQLNASRRIVCSTASGTFVPTTDDELERGLFYRTRMARALLRGAETMRNGWEANKLERTTAQGEERA